MTDALLWHRLQFGFTIVFHYLFPQLTMGLALAIAVLKSREAFANDDIAGDCARFLSRQTMKTPSPLTFTFWSCVFTA